MEHREERILVETSRYRITGVVSLPLHGYRSRLTDYLNAGERTFLALTDVELVPLDNGRPAERRPFLALALSQVVYAMPADPAAAGDPATGEDPATAGDPAAGGDPATAGDPAAGGNPTPAG